MGNNRLGIGVLLALVVGLLSSCFRVSFFAGTFVPVTAPTFSKTSGAYSAPVTVSILDSTPGLTIRYTTDPNASPSNQAAWETYSGPIPVATTTNLRAYAYADSNNLSPMTSGVYSIGGLINLTFSAGLLSPVFLPYAYQYYDYVVTTGAASVSVTPTSAVAGQTITVNGTSVASGTASQVINLNPGPNSVAVKTSGGDAPSYTYSIDVYFTIGPKVGGDIIGTPLNLPSAANTVVTTLLTNVGFVAGLTTDGHYLYYAALSQDYIGRIDLQTKANMVLAGTPGAVGAGTTADDGVGTASRWVNPYNLTLDGTTLYATDKNRIRMINLLTNQVTTIAGTGAVGCADNSNGLNAQFNGNPAITVVGSTLYVADYGCRSIRTVNLTSHSVSTLMSTTADVNNSSNTYAPSGITTDGTNLYVALGPGTNAGNVIWKISNLSGTPTETILAGQLGVSGSTDGLTGAASSFDTPQNICTDGFYQYVTEWTDDVRRVADTTGATITIGGTQSTTGNTNGSGTVALFGQLRACTTDGVHLYVADAGNNEIRVLSP